MTKLENTIKQIIADQLNWTFPVLITLDDTISGLGADSLDAVEIVMAIEDQFDIEIPDEDWERVVTVKDAVELVGNFTGAKYDE